MHIAVAAVLLVSITLFYLHYFSIHHDLAGGVLSGKLGMSLGEAYEGYNIYFPPSEKIWFSLAAWLQTITGLRLDLLVVLMTSVAILFSAELAYLIRKKTVGATPLFLIVSIAALVILPIVFKNVFGLREHLVALGLWPYLVLRVSDPAGVKIDRSIRIVVGLWLGLALLFKYLYSVVVLLVETADAIVQRRPVILFRLENLISGFIVVFYLLFWLGFQSDNREIVGAMVSGLNANLMSPLDSLSRAGLEFCIAAVILLAARQSGATIRQIVIGFACVTGAILVASAQSRWYTHHGFPIFLGYVFWLWILGANFSKVFKIIVCAMLVFSAGREFSSISFYQSNAAALTNSLKEQGLSLKEKRIALLTLHPSPFNQVIAEQGGVRWTPFVNIAYIPAELKKFDSDENSGMLAPPVVFSEPGRKLLHNQMLSLWEDFPPDVLIMDNSSSWPFAHLKVDWNHMLSKDERFSNILSDFQLAHSLQNGGVKYDYYTRKQSN
ncbi:MAG: hypothetical protein AAGA76_15805 [Pseudomonadota bacterium]